MRRWHADEKVQTRLNLICAGVTDEKAHFIAIPVSRICTVCLWLSGSMSLQVCNMTGREPAIVLVLCRTSIVHRPVREEQRASTATVRPDDSHTTTESGDWHHRPCANWRSPTRGHGRRESITA
jgi:hypothetical protein